MSTFREQLSQLRRHPGVLDVVAVGRDGLVIDAGAREPGAGEPGAGEPTAEAVAALTPGVMAAAELLAEAAGAGSLRAVVVEGAAGYATVIALTHEVVVVVALRALGDAGAVIAEARAARGALSAAV